MRRITKFAKFITALLCLVLLASMSGIASVSAAETGVRGYVARLYEYVLQRPADDIGLDYWTDRMANGTTAAEVASGFFNSEEMISRDLTNEEYVTILYKSILGRDTDPTGLEYWVSQLEEGFPRNQALAGFVASTEFEGICNSYGVTRGSIAVTDLLEVNYKTAQFVTRAYSLILNRTPDEGGLRDWVRKLADGSITASDMIYGFYASDEFTSREMTDEEYVQNLYMALLSREGDEVGVNEWISTMEDGMASRMHPLKGFIDSIEFGLLCESYGIRKGSFTPMEGRDLNLSANKLVIGAYKMIFDRTPNLEELNHWTRQFYNGTSVAVFINSVTTAPSFVNMTTEDQITTVYAIALNRIPSEEELAAAVSTITSSGISAFLDSIYHSDEFDAVCASKKLGSFFSTGLNSVNGRIFYFVNGALATGWQRVDGNRYYFDPENGNAAVMGWKRIDGYKYYFDETNGVLWQNTDSIVNAQGRYYLTVNCYTNTVMVYAFDDETGTYDIPVKAIVCSTGAAGTGTVQGDFTIERLQPWRILSGDVWGQYCSRISGNYLFHSAWFYENGNHQSLSVRQYNRLGTNASHGCVRLTTIDAQWIYNNCNGCPVHVFTANEEAPFDKPVPPTAVVVNGDYGYDPTDPAL